MKWQIYWELGGYKDRESDIKWGKVHWMFGPKIRKWNFLVSLGLNRSTKKVGCSECPETHFGFGFFWNTMKFWKSKNFVTVYKKTQTPQREVKWLRSCGCATKNPKALQRRLWNYHILRLSRILNIKKWMITLVAHLAWISPPVN